VAGRTSKIDFRDGRRFFLKNEAMRRRYCISCFLAALCVLFVCSVCAGGIIYVDDDALNDPFPHSASGSDPNECGSQAHPFDTIQEAIDAVEEGSTIEVLPGSYPDAEPESRHEIDFKNKNFVLRSTDPNDWNVVNSTIINGSVYFGGSEDPNCKLIGFKIYNYKHCIIDGWNTHATISNCNISGNAPCNAPVMMEFDGLINNCLIADNNCRCDIYPVIWGCNGIIRNCTIANNISGIAVNSAVIENSIIYHNDKDGIQIGVAYGETIEISYCDIQGGLQGISAPDGVIWGLGNIDADPCFVSLGQWDANSAQLSEGDYHLKSFGWRIDEADPLIWIFDRVTSRCIDAGNPGYSLNNELMSAPNDPYSDYAINVRINMGAYGGTNQASLAPYDWSLQADLNNDGVVDFEDISLIAEDWLIGKARNPSDLDRNGVINMCDFALFGQIWQKSTDWAQ